MQRCRTNLRRTAPQDDRQEEKGAVVGVGVAASEGVGAVVNTVGARTGTSWAFGDNTDRVEGEAGVRVGVGWEGA